MNFQQKKKNPLVLPPEFNELPKPKTLTAVNKDEEEIDLKNIIIKKSSVTKKISVDKTMNSTLEKKILENIKKN